MAVVDPDKTPEGHVGDINRTWFAADPDGGNLTRAQARSDWQAAAEAAGVSEEDVTEALRLHGHRRG